MKKLVVLFAMVAAAAFAFANSDTASHTVQLNVPEVVLIDVNNAGVVTLDIVAPAQGGLVPTGETDSTKYLWYTAINSGVTTRTITVAWGGADAAPAGTHLEVEALSVTGGAGTRVAGGRTITNVAQTIVTAIPSCVTGQAANGANLEYRLIVDTPASLLFGDNHLVTITFTLTDGA